jgi:hypothetical protein
VPHYWIKVGANPKSPREMRDAAREAGKAQLLGGELFFKPGQRKRGYATIECADDDAARDYIEALVAKGLTGQFERVLTADEIESEQFGDGDLDGDDYAEAD